MKNSLAIISKIEYKVKALLDFAVYGHALQNRIVLLQLKTIRGVLTVLLRYVTRSTWHATGLVLSTFENNLDAVTFRFLCHDGIDLKDLQLQLHSGINTFAL